jgi:hypothetical protein
MLIVTSTPATKSRLEAAILSNKITKMSYTRKERTTQFSRSQSWMQMKRHNRLKPLGQISKSTFGIKETTARW